MADKAKTPVLILVFLSLAGGVFYLYRKEHATKLKLQEDLEDIQTKLNITERKLEEAQKKISMLDPQLKDAQTQITTLKNDLEQEKTAKQKAEAQTEQLRMDLEQQKALRSDLEKKFSQAQLDFKKAQDKLNELEFKKTELETKIKELEAKAQEGVELGKIVVGPEAAPPVSTVPEPAQTKVKPVKAKEEKKKTTTAPAKGLEGKVLVVNKDYDFVVINLGNRDGVNIGDIFSIYKDDKYVGDIKVEKIHDTMAAAGFVSSNIKDKVNENDIVVQKTK